MSDLPSDAEELGLLDPEDIWPEDPPREHSPEWDRCEHAVIPDLVNVFYPTGDAYVWFVGVDDGADVCIEEMEDLPTHGTLSPLLENERDQAGFGDMMEVEWRWDSKSTGMTWLMQHGIAPGQPFLMRFGEPEYTGGGYWEPNEVDVSYESELVRVIPWSTEKAWKAWDDFVRARREHLAWVERRTREVKHERMTRTDLMEVRTVLYWTRQDYSDGPPGGLRFVVVSLYEAPDGFSRGPAHLISGESDRSDRDEAWADLAANAVKYDFPLKTVEEFQALKKSWRNW